MGKPKIRFKGFTEEWEQRKLLDISDIVTGTTPPTKDKDNYDGNRLFVSPADIQGNRFIERTITTLTEKGHALGRELRPGTSLFVSIGSTIGKVAQIEEFATTNQQINAVIPYDKMEDEDEEIYFINLGCRNGTVHDLIYGKLRLKRIRRIVKRTG